MIEPKKRDGAECEILCRTCALWVTDDMKKGFCLAEDLFTHTCRTVCGSYIKDKPMTGQEWDDFQYAEAL